MIISSALLAEADGEGDSVLELAAFRAVAIAAKEVHIDPIVTDAMGEVDPIVELIVL